MKSDNKSDDDQKDGYVLDSRAVRRFKTGTKTKRPCLDFDPIFKGNKYSYALTSKMISLLNHDQKRISAHFIW